MEKYLLGLEIGVMFTALGVAMLWGVMVLGNIGFASMFMWAVVMVTGVFTMVVNMDILEQFEEEI